MQINMINFMRYFCFSTASDEPGCSTSTHTGLTTFTNHQW